MRIISIIFIGTALLYGCGQSSTETREQSIDSESVHADKPVVIDDTPVKALAIGGSMLALHSTVSMDDPENPAWRDAQEYRMELGLAPPVHQSINLRYDPSLPALPVYLRAASDGKNLYLRMRWADSSENRSTGRTDFADAAAVQFDLQPAADGGASSTSFMMGAPGGPVNIWYWKAGQENPQNLAAGGFGNTTRLDSGALMVSEAYREQGEWVVVFSRPLAQPGEHMIQLDQSPANVAFALWQGEQRQRDGLKHVSMGWVSLQTTGESSGT